MMILSRDLTLKSGAAKDARALAMTPGRGTPGTMRRSAGKRAGPVTSGVTTTARRLITGSDGRLLTCLSMNEIRRMHAALCHPAPPAHPAHPAHPAGALPCSGQHGAAAIRPSPADVI